MLYLLCCAYGLELGTLPSRFERYISIFLDESYTALFLFVLDNRVDERIEAFIVCRRHRLLRCQTRSTLNVPVGAFANCFSAEPLA